MAKKVFAISQFFLLSAGGRQRERWAALTSCLEKNLTAPSLSSASRRQRAKKRTAKGGGRQRDNVIFGRRQRGNTAHRSITQIDDLARSQTHISTLRRTHTPATHDARAPRAAPTRPAPCPVFSLPYPHPHRTSLSLISLPLDPNRGGRPAGTRHHLDPRPRPTPRRPLPHPPSRAVRLCHATGARLRAPPSFARPRSPPASSASRPASPASALCRPPPRAAGLLHASEHQCLRAPAAARLRLRWSLPPSLSTPPSFSSRAVGLHLCCSPLQPASTCRGPPPPLLFSAGDGAWR